MARATDKQLKGIPAVTQSGQKVGKLAGWVFDVDTHAVVQYVVTRSRSLSHLLPGELLVSPRQVVSIDEDMMVLEDDAVPALAKAKALAINKTASADAALGSTYGARRRSSGGA